jgi:hypothetical protein
MDYLEPLARPLLNLLENIRNLRYRYFQFHGAFSFRLGFGQNPSKGKTLFFYLFYALMNLHKKSYTAGSLVPTRIKRLWCCNMLMNRYECSVSYLRFFFADGLAAACCFSASKEANMISAFLAS